MPETNTLQSAALRKYKKTRQGQEKQALIDLKIAYEDDKRLLSHVVNKLADVERVYPRHLPTQASFRWSTFDPPITNWPRRCISADCTREDHEWTAGCWSVRDILRVDEEEVLLTWDHDNAEGRIHDLIVADALGLEAYAEGYDLHTITCCKMFNYRLPPNLKNPHTSPECADWRTQYAWQGKDTKQRVLAKNFNHGSKYSKSYRFVYTLPDVERYGANRKQLTQLAQEYIAGKGAAWQRKLDIMATIRKTRVARTLYGGRRVFFDGSEETEKEGFSHMVSGTMSDYNNRTLILLAERYGDSFRLLHNAHDGNKVAFHKDVVTPDFLSEVRSIVERPITYNDRQVVLTAGLVLKQ